MKMGRGRAMLYISIKAADWKCSETRTELEKTICKVTAKPAVCQAIRPNRAKWLSWFKWLCESLNSPLKVVMKIPALFKWQFKCLWWCKMCSKHNVHWQFNLQGNKKMYQDLQKKTQKRATNSLKTGNFWVFKPQKATITLPETKETKTAAVKLFDHIQSRYTANILSPVIK